MPKKRTEERVESEDTVRRLDVIIRLLVRDCVQTSP